jgi:hypothetical protein
LSEYDGYGAEFGEFADDIRAIEEFNSRQIDFAKREMDSARAQIFLEETLMDVEDVKSKVRKYLQTRQEVESKAHQYQTGSTRSWVLQDEIAKRGHALKHKLSLLSVGLDSNALGEVVDDYFHNIEDAYDGESRSLRKELREKMLFLSRSEREYLLREMLEQGRIDQNQYFYLRSEFL